LRKKKHNERAIPPVQNAEEDNFQMEDLREGILAMRSVEPLDYFKSREYDGENRFCVVFPRDEFHDYERRILSDGSCPYVLPMSFIEEEAALRVCYSCDGCLVLKDAVAIQVRSGNSRRWSETPACDALGILMNVLDHLKKMENHLLFPEFISISIDEVYIHTESGKVLLAYVPFRGKQTEFRNEIINLAEEIKRLYEPSEAEHFLNRFMQYVDENHPGLNGMVNMLGMIRREASYIYTVSENFRSNISGSGQELDAKRDCGGISSEKREALGQDNEKKNKMLSFAQLFRYPILFLCIMGAAVLSGLFDTTQLAGLAIIAAASGLWLIRRSRLLLQSREERKGKHSAHIG